MLDTSGNLITFGAKLMSCQAPQVGCLPTSIQVPEAFVHSQTTTALSVPLTKVSISSPFPARCGLKLSPSFYIALPFSLSLRCNMAMQVAPQPFPAATQPEPDIMDIDIDMDVDLEPLEGDYDLEVLGLSLH